jgi:hypothetical protein
VQACRYCGLLDASVAAYERARRLDPGVVTSVSQTFFLRGDWEQVMATDRTDPPFNTAMALVQLGRANEGVELLRSSDVRGWPPRFHKLINGMIAALEGRHDDLVREIHQLTESGFGDTEGFYHWAAALAEAGDHDGALGLLERCINGGFYPASALVRDPRFDAVRAGADFRHLVVRADERQREALEAFRAADGARMLGLPQVSSQSA